MKFLFLFFLCASAIAQEKVPSTSGDVSTSSEILTNAELKKQLDEMNEKIKSLELKSASKAESEKSKVSVFGDLRLRQQNEKTNGFDERRIQRFQLKLGLKVEFSNELQAYARLLTGSGLNSGNITLGDSKQATDSRRSIGVDWAYFNYQPLDFLIFQGGKLPAPFYFVGKNQLILDRDIAPEGWVLKMPFEFSDEWSMTLVGLGSWVVENYDSSSGLDATDSFFNGAQAFAKWKRDNTSVIAGIGTFSFTKIKDNEPRKFFGNSSDASLNSGRGNSLVIDPLSSLNVYQFNYDLSEVFIEIKQKIKDWELGIFQENVENYNASTMNKASSFGVTAQYKNWSGSYIIQKIEKDSVFALFTDSDFANNFTSSKGSILQVSYKPTKETNLTFTYYNNRTEIDTSIPGRYKRTHLDFTLNF